MTALRTALVALVLGCIAFSPAAACLAPGFQHAILFHEIPFGLDAPIIARVTVVDTHSEIKHRKFVAARVDQTIKGKLAGNYVTFSYVESSCGPFGIRVGHSGIMLGSITRVDNGVSELSVVDDSYYRMHERKKAKGLK